LTQEKQHDLLVFVLNEHGIGLLKQITRLPRLPKKQPPMPVPLRLIRWLLLRTLS
jgi:hypothetical protein